MGEWKELIYNFEIGYQLGRFGTADIRAWGGSMDIGYRFADLKGAPTIRLRSDFFVVIFITLVFQGLTLPAVIRLTGIRELDAILPDHEQHAGIRLRLDTGALQRLTAQHTSASSNSLLKGYAEKLKREIEGHQVYLKSVEICMNRNFEREEFN